MINKIIGFAFLSCSFMTGNAKAEFTYGSTSDACRAHPELSYCNMSNNELHQAVGSTGYMGQTAAGVDVFLKPEPSLGNYNPPTPNPDDDITPTPDPNGDDITPTPDPNGGETGCSNWETRDDFVEKANGDVVNCPKKVCVD